MGDSHDQGEDKLLSMSDAWHEHILWAHIPSISLGTRFTFCSSSSPETWMGRYKWSLCMCVSLLLLARKDVTKLVRVCKNVHHKNGHCNSVKLACTGLCKCSADMVQFLNVDAMIDDCD